MYKGKKEGARQNSSGVPKVIIILVLVFGLVGYFGWKFMATLMDVTPPVTSSVGSQSASEKQDGSMSKKRWSHRDISKLIGKPATEVIELLGVPSTKTEHQTSDTNYQTWKYYDVTYHNHM